MIGGVEPMFLDPLWKMFYLERTFRNLEPLAYHDEVLMLLFSGEFVGLCIIIIVFLPHRFTAKSDFPFI